MPVNSLFDFFEFGGVRFQFLKLFTYEVYVLRAIVGLVDVGFKRLYHQVLDVLNLQTIFKSGIHIEIQLLTLDLNILSARIIQALI